VLLEEQGVPAALSDAGSAEREGRANVMLIITNMIPIFDIGILF
jgi:hypothetical protein